MHRVLHRVTIKIVPTERHRHMITETDDIKSALATAARRWPDETPSELLRRLITAGQQALKVDVEHRRRVIIENAGALSGTYEPGYLEKLREDWPE